MARVLAPMAAVLVLVASTALAAPPPDPVEVNGPREGEKVELGKGRFEILPSPYRDAKKFDCTVTQGSTVWKSGDQPGPHCEVPAAEQAKFKAGPATVSVRAFFRKAWLQAAKVTVELIAKGPCSGPKCGGEIAAASGAPFGRAAAAGIAVGSSVPASWDSHYAGSGRTIQLLWCPGMWDMQNFDVAGGEAKFQVWLGAVGTTGSPKKAPSEDEAAHVWVNAKIGADGTVAGAATFSAATIAWGKAHPDQFPAGATGLAFRGKVTNDDAESAWTFDIGRVFSGAVTAVGGTASCEFGATAADYKHILTPAGRAALAEASKPRPAGRGCVFDKDCQSGVCSRDFDPKKGSKCL